MLFARINFFEDYQADLIDKEVPTLLKRAAEIRLLNEETLPNAVNNLLHAQIQQRKTQDDASGFTFGRF